MNRGLLADARGALANAQYYTTWLMRLEGLPREEWQPEIEASRQNYKLLAERAELCDLLVAAGEGLALPGRITPEGRVASAADDDADA